MKLALVLATITLGVCGGTFPAPTQRLADAEGAYRSAQELGADKEPQSKLHLKLAEEEIAKANALIKNEENHEADLVLIRAKADAELALALAHEQKSKAEAEAAREKFSAQNTLNAKGTR